MVFVAAVAIAIAVLFLNPMVPGNRVVGPSAIVGRSAADSLPPNPAKCGQGNGTIDVSLSSGDMHDTLLQDYDTLGKAGGGTLKLEEGVYEINETINFQTYSNVSIQGAGMGKTILSLPPSPIGKFTADNGSLVGVYNTSLHGPSNGISANFIEVSGPDPIDNFEMCDLTVDAQANNASEDWSGSLIFDESGGVNHVYSDIAEVGFFGPSSNPNGLHLESSPADTYPGIGYTIDNLFADNNTVPFENYSGFKGGPNFLNVGTVVNCTIDRVMGIGQVALEVAPPRGCVLENWNVDGYLTIDPLSGGTWGGTLFQNVSVRTNGTVASIALSSCVPDGPRDEYSNFTALRWVDDHFYGTVVGGANLVDVENSTFDGELNSTPAIFEGNTVTWARTSPQRLTLPIQVEGAPAGGASSVLKENRFNFPNGTGKNDLFQLTVPQNTWSNDTVQVSGSTSGYVMNAPGVAVSQSSIFSHVTYDSLGNGSPTELVLVDMAGSPDFQDLGAAVGPLSEVYNNLPLYVPSTPEGLTGRAIGPTEVKLTWNSTSGPLTNFTVLVGNSSESLTLGYSVGVTTDYEVEGLIPGTEHFFSVESWNGSFHSSFETPIEVTTPPLPNGAPGVPTGLAVNSVQAVEVGIHWSASSGTVTNYTVYLGTSVPTMTPRYSVGNVTSFTVTGLAPDTTYYLAVDAWNLSWPSGLSGPVNVTTLSVEGHPRAPGVPTALTVTHLESSEIGIRWEPSVGNVTNYTVYLGTTVSTLTPRYSAGEATSFTVVGLHPGTTYYFAVEAWNGSLTSGPSAPVNATTLLGGVPPGAGSMSAFDWIVVSGTMVGVIVGVVGPLVLVSLRRTSTLSRTRARTHSRRASSTDRS